MRKVPSQIMEYSRTREAATVEKRSKWDLIEAIALDAVDADLPITGVDSILAAKEALDAAGSDYADRTVKDLCAVAKFDYEATTLQRGIFRNYGWTVIRQFADAGWPQEKSAKFLAGKHRSFRDVQAAVKKISPRAGTDPPLIDAWRAWLNRAATLLEDGARLAERTETETAELGPAAELALLIYQRITESKLDAEIRSLLESEDAEVDR